MPTSYFHVLGHSDIWEYNHGATSRVRKRVNIQRIVHDAVKIIVSIRREVVHLKLVHQTWYDVIGEYLYVVVPVRSLLLVVKPDQVTQLVHYQTSVLQAREREKDWLAIFSVDSKLFQSDSGGAAARESSAWSEQTEL